MTRHENFGWAEIFNISGKIVDPFQETIRIAEQIRETNGIIDNFVSQFTMVETFEKIRKGIIETEEDVRVFKKE